MMGKGKNDMSPKETKVHIDKYREQVKFYLEANSFESALFWADKVASMSDEDPRDIYWLAQCMYRSKQYHRTANLIKNKGLDKRQPLLQWLAAMALLEINNNEDALQILFTEEEQLEISKSNTQVTQAPTSNNVHLNIPPVSDDCILEGFTKKSLQSAILLLKGRVYIQLGNQRRAAECFKYALIHNVYCFEAFQALVQHQMFTPLEEKDLLTSLPFKEQCTEHDLLPAVYEVLLNKYQDTPNMSSEVSLPHPLSDNLDMEVARAEKLYYTYSYKQCFSLTEEILQKDQYHPTCLPIHVSLLVELKKTTKLFYLAHNLVEVMPEKAISWYAVGCFYFLTGKQDQARRYLAKATSLDKLFGPAWLAYGHSCAVENEHDQAKAAYFFMIRLMKGCHLPYLYIGLECGLTNDIILAEKFLTQAQSMAPDDPFVIQELGVVAFQNCDYALAEKHFLTALSHVPCVNQSITIEKWEPLLNNLGHTCRKLKKYDEALQYHHQALMLSPQNVATFSCIGFIHAIKGNLTEASYMFHKALSIRKDDSFSTSMFSLIVEKMVETPVLSEDSLEPEFYRLTTPQ